MLRIKLVKSPIAQLPRNRATVAALGLRKISQEVTKEDTPSIRGMIHQVAHMLIVWDGENETPIVDGRFTRKHASRKDKKPCETH